MLHTASCALARSVPAAAPGCLVCSPALMAATISSSGATAALASSVQLVPDWSSNTEPRREASFSATKHRSSYARCLANESSATGTCSARRSGSVSAARSTL